VNYDKLTGVYETVMCLCVWWRAVPESVGARSVLVFSHWCVYPAQPVFWCHQETRMSAPGSGQELHETLLKGTV